MRKFYDNKILTGVLAIILAVTIACTCYNVIAKTNGDEEQNTDPKVIGATLASSEASYQYALGNLLLTESADDADYKLDIRYAEWDSNKQVEQIREFIKDDVDAIILCPVNAKSYLNVLKEAKNAGIPVINMNMKVDTVSTEYITTYVGASMSEEADLAGQMVVECLNGAQGKVGIIEGTQGTDPQIYRTQTFLEYLSGYPDIEVVGIAEANWSREKAGDVAEDLLEQNPDINVFYCHDSNMALGVYDVLDEKGLTDQIKVIGIGNEEEHIQAIKDGKIYGIVTQPPEFEAYYARYCAKKAADGETLRHWYKNIVMSITKENADSYESPLLDESV